MCMQDRDKDKEKTAVKTRKTNVFLKKCVDLFAQVCYNALDL